MTLLNRSTSVHLSTVTAVEQDCTSLKMEPAMVLKRQKKKKNMDISKKRNKINSM